MKLDIGCGRVKVGPDWTGVDAYVEADICAPMWRIPLPDASVEQIYSSHALEHIGKYQVIPTLGEWKRLLILGGTITLRVPDLVWCCTNWLVHQTNDWWLDTLFGNQEHEGEYHRTGFTRSIMENYLQQAGLTLVAYHDLETHNQHTMEFIIRKD